jgi:hypothetical protein
LLGQPFHVQFIPGPGDSIAEVIAGADEAIREGQRALDARWRHTVPRRADLVIASLGGDPTQHTFADLCAALNCAERVVEPDGRIVLLTRALPQLGPGTDTLRQQEPRAAAVALQRHPTLELLPALQWARAASRAHLFVLSELADDTVEEMAATPLAGREQVQRLINASRSCLFLEDAHKMMVVVEEE